MCDSAAVVALPALSVLHKCSSRCYKELLKDKYFRKVLLAAFEEIALNYLHNDSLPLTVDERKRIKKLHSVLEKLTSTKKAKKLELVGRKKLCTLLDIFLSKHAKI